ncbi:thioesterase II family protein [Bacillus thuringiensis]|uniref:thioesterase II family protein n=1 Tax=Bacillus tropicus TaxID=2026188 RepID=UPI0035D7C888
MDKNLTLFCIPYAGGSARVYYRWKKLLHPRIEVVPIELAGRGERYKEPFYLDFNQAVDDVYRIINSRLERDMKFAIFGHSMGGYIAYELYNLVPKENLIHIYFSGLRPPHLGIEDKKINELDREGLVRELVRLGGTPQEIIDQPEFLNMFLPILRADFNIMAKYKHLNHTLIQKPISILYGLKDHIRKEEVFEWASYTTKTNNCNFYPFSGGHFFIQENEQQVINIINEISKQTNYLSY